MIIIRKTEPINIKPKKITIECADNITVILTALTKIESTISQEVNELDEYNFSIGAREVEIVVADKPDEGSQDDKPQFDTDIIKKYGKLFEDKTEKFGDERKFTDYECI